MQYLFLASKLINYKILVDEISNISKLTRLSGNLVIFVHEEQFKYVKLILY